MTDTTDPRPDLPPVSAPPKGGRGLKIALAVSLALNLGVAGLVLGAVLHGGPDMHGPRDRDLGFGPFAEALSPDDRKALRRELVERMPELKSMRAQIDADLGQMLTLLRAEPFDPAALRDVMARQRARLEGQLSLGGTLLADHLAGLTQAERLAFADRLEAAMRHEGKAGGGKDGGKEGGGKD